MKEIYTTTSVDANYNQEIKEKFLRKDPKTMDELRACGLAAIRRYGMDTHQIEDALQELFLRCWEKAPEYDPARASPSTLIYSIVRNLATEVNRKKFREAKRFFQSSQVAGQRSAYEEVGEREDKERLMIAMTTLSLEEKEALTLKMAGFTGKEISQLYNIPQTTVSHRIRRAQRHLAQIVGN